MVKTRKKPVIPKIKFVVSLKGQRWTISMYTKSSFSKLWNDCVGIAEYDHVKNIRNINFKGPSVSRDTIAHEIMHAYLSYIDFSKRSENYIEEKICEVIGKNHKNIYNLTNKIYRKLKSS